MSVNTVRFKFFKKDELKYLSHLDVLALMERALMRTGMHLLYSGGFHPKPKLSFSNPIPLGVQSIAEYCDIELLEEISVEDFTDHLNRKLPDNLKVTKAVSFEKIPENKIAPLMSAIDVVIYEYELLPEAALLKEPKSKAMFEKSTVDKERQKTGQLIKISLIANDYLSSFIKDFKKLFCPAGKEEECEAELQKIRNSIHDYEISTFKIAAENETASAKTAEAAQTTTAAQNAAAVQTSSAENTAGTSLPGPPVNIFFLKICGYAKILKNSSNTIFKFNAFNEYFEKFLEAEGIAMRQVQKTGAYILKDNVLTDPIEAIASQAKS